MLATTFNTLTDSIVRFQREAAQRERLSSLGRLSTVIAHEVRNPLMIIKGALRTLDRDGASAADVRDAAKDIDEEIERLNSLVNDVLDVARPIRFDPAPTDINAVCRDAVQAAARRRRGTARCTLDLAPALPDLITDSERLRTVLVNLLTNAAARDRAATRARPRGGRRALITQRLGDRRVAITIRDNGTGIADDDPAAHLRSILHDAARRHRPRSRHRQEHRRRPGRLDQRDHPAGRRHRLPHRARRRTGAQRNAMTDPMAGSILLADDEEKILKTLGRALRDDGHEVVTASNAQEAARLLSERSFDLLVIDFLMPDRTGLDVIRELAASTPEAERPAVVMMTAHGSIESAVEAMKLGARDYLQKPFEVDELLVLARRALEDQRARTGLRYLLSERDAEFDHYGIIGRSRADSRRDRARGAGRRIEEHGAAHRRDRHRQGAGRARHPRPQRAAQHADDQGELRGDSRDAARIGAVRPRARRVHRRDLHQEGPLRAGRRRHDLPRRDRHHLR